MQVKEVTALQHNKCDRCDSQWRSGGQWW